MIIRAKKFMLQVTSNRAMSLKLKVAFFSESAICCLDLQISKKNIPKNYLELEV